MHFAISTICIGDNVYPASSSFVSINDERKRVSFRCKKEYAHRIVHDVDNPSVTFDECC